jgi:hypothetical protein
LEGVVLEAGHGGDVVVVEGEDVEAGSVAGAVRGVEVGAEGRLAVGPGGGQVESAAGAEEGGTYIVSSRSTSGERLEPDDFAEPGGFGRFDAGDVAGLGRAPVG